jgi:hypothetical protein
MSSRGPIVAVALSVVAAVAGCGGRDSLLAPPAGAGGAGGGAASMAPDGGDAGSPKLGPVDPTQAPPTLAMTCDHGIGTLAFDDPCLIGGNLAGDPSTIGFHEVECSFASLTHPVAWAFVLPLGELSANPDETISFPNGRTPPPPGPSTNIDVGPTGARVSNVAGLLTFSRVDPTARAFVGHFAGTIDWIESGGETFSCAVDAPLWGAPGAFL